MALKHIHSQNIARFVRREWPLLALVGSWLIFFGRLITGQFVYFLDDFKIIYYPLEVAFAAFQQSHRLPEWSPLFGMGQPLLAWGQLGFFTPLHLLLRTLHVDPINLLQISVVSYFLLGLLGVYTVLRLWRLHPLAAAVGSIVYTFSGFNIGHLNHVNFYVGTMVLPWLLVAITVFLRRPTLARAMLMTVLSAVISLSAQPQVVLYVFCLAALYGVISWLSWWRKCSRTQLMKVVLFTFLAALIALLLSALAILPLLEFLPLTERGEDLPVAELLEFSYPPSHAITLIAPYFFGNHASYWGAKGFQELAAFTGLLPLMLAGLALTTWRRHSALRAWGSVSVLIAVVMALGAHSPLYSYLVTNHLLTSLNIPGRFVFFFTTGIAILAAVGVHDIIRYQPRPRRRWVELAAPLLLPSVFLASFAFSLSSNPIYFARAKELLRVFDYAFVLAGLGALVYCFTWYMLGRTRKYHLLAVPLFLLTAATLVSLGYNYTPVVPRSSLAQSLPFVEPLQTYAKTAGVPARLYARDILLDDLPRHKLVATEPFSPRYTILQPIVITNLKNPCFFIPMHSATTEGFINVSLLAAIDSPALDTVTVNAHKTVSEPEQRICFSAQLPGDATEAFLHFSSSVDTTIRLEAYPVDDLSAYLVRVEKPAADIIRASQKKLRIDLAEDFSAEYDMESLLLARHLQVVGQASGARWIGALSLKPYRDFIEEFLANDKHPFDGDGRHVIEANRSIVNMLGITHLTQYLPPESHDRMTAVGYSIVKEVKVGSSTFRLYQNPAAFPKAWLVPNASFIAAADETRVAMKEPSFDPAEHVYISGPKPPNPAELLQTSDNTPIDGEVTITAHEPTRIAVDVTAPRDAWLVISDATTPQWQTFIDGQSAPHYLANTFMKTAFVPAGQHTVSFVYHSPATERALRLTYAGLALLGVCCLTSLVAAVQRYRGSASPQVGVPPHTS